jgi:predicted GTPase
MSKRRCVILGAAGRDFHNFNVYLRDNEYIEVVAFTATQIPNIDDRRYPPELAGTLYPRGIPILPELELHEIIEKENIQEVFFSYSDVSHEYVMHTAAKVNALGPTFSLLGPKVTMLKARVPVIAVCAVRTGSGKSQTTRRIASILTENGKRVVVVRHPMPYGDLVAQRIQRFAALDDLTKNDCTIEEMEEYEPHIVNNIVVYAGVDYEAILTQAQQEADIILWDGGNNDTPFYQPTIHVVVVDPLRPGHEVSYYPGETNLRMADWIVINKETDARTKDIEEVRRNIRNVNPGAGVIDAASPLSVENADVIAGKRVLVIEDGPTLTHGGMTFGAGTIAARRFGANEIVDPRPFLQGSLRETFKTYPDIGKLLPAMGYGREQMNDLQATIEKTECDAVVIGTPIDLRRIIDIAKPTVRVKYELQEIGSPTLEDALKELLK